MRAAPDQHTDPHPGPIRHPDPGSERISRAGAGARSHSRTDLSVSTRADLLVGPRSVVEHASAAGGILERGPVFH